MLFLVHGNVTFTPYMGSSKERKVIRLVDATDEDEATEKFEKHFADMSIPNDDSYYASVTEVSECIV